MDEIPIWRRRRIVAISRFVTRKPTGHGRSFYDSVNSYNQESQSLSVAGCKGSPEDLAQPLFPIWANSPPNYVSLIPSFALRVGSIKNWLSKKEPDHVLIYDGTLEDLWWSWKLAVNFPKMHFHFNFHFADLVANQLSLGNPNSPVQNQLTYRLRSIFKKKPCNLLVYGESAELAALISAALDTETRPFPVPTNHNLPEKPEQLKKLVDVLIVCRWDSLIWVKNYLAELDKPEYRKLRVVVQDFTSELGQSESYKLLPSDLSKNEYENLIKSTKVTVLPYFSDFYKLGSSGRVQDALASWVLPLVPGFTSMHSSLKNQLGKEYPDIDEEFSPASVARATLDSINYPRKIPQPVNFEGAMAILVANSEERQKRHFQQDLDFSRLELIRWQLAQINTLGFVGWIGALVWDAKALILVWQDEISSRKDQMQERFARERF